MNSTNGNVVEEPFALKIVLRLFYVLVFSVGLCGNLLVCIVIVQQHRMRTVINYFTLNLALSDLIVIIIYLPSQLAAFENNQNWPLGNIGCRIIYSIVPVCLSASIATLLAISCERFRGIVFPFQPHLRLGTVRKIILLIWLVSLVTAAPLMFVAGTVHKRDKVFCDEQWPSPGSSRFYWIAIFLVQYVIPLFVMIVLYGIAGWKLQNRSFLKSRIGSCINSSAESARQRQSQKITKMLVALILLYSFCMLPQHVIYFWITYGDFWQWEYSLYLFRISNLFSMANSALNSIAYGTLKSDFRKAYKKFFKSYKLRCCRENSHKTSNQTKYIKRERMAAIKRKPSQNEFLVEKQFCQNLTQKMVTNNCVETLNTIRARRLSSDTGHFLISGESTTATESQKSKQDDFETQKETCRKDSSTNKATKTLNQIAKNDNLFYENIQPSTIMYVINTDAAIVTDSIDPRCNLDVNIALDDIRLLESAKETTL